MTTVAIPTAGLLVLDDRNADFESFVAKAKLIPGFRSAGTPTDFSKIFLQFSPDIAQITAETAVQAVVAEHTAAALMAVMLERMEQVNQLRDVWGASHFLYDGKRWDCDAKGVRNIEKVNVSALLLAKSNQDLPANFVFRSKDNINVPANAAYMAGMDMALFKFGNDCYVASWIHKYMISQCATVAAVKAYDITVGWPDRG